MNYDFNMKKVDNSIELTRLEWEILEELINAKGRPLSAREICDTIYEKYCVTGINSQDTTENAIRVHISRLKKKIKGKIKIKNRTMLGYYIE